jgi:hypothetical protein
VISAELKSGPTIRRRGREWKKLNEIWKKSSADAGKVAYTRTFRIPLMELNALSAAKNGARRGPTFTEFATEEPDCAVFKKSLELPVATKLFVEPSIMSPHETRSDETLSAYSTLSFLLNSYVRASQLLDYLLIFKEFTYTSTALYSYSGAKSTCAKLVWKLRGSRSQWAHSKASPLVKRKESFVPCISYNNSRYSALGTRRSILGTFFTFCVFLFTNLYKSYSQLYKGSKWRARMILQPLNS